MSPISQDWHLITRPEEVARALALAFPAAGEQEGAAAMEVEVAGKVAGSRVQEEEEEEDDDDEVVIMELPQGRPAASPRTGEQSSPSWHPSLHLLCCHRVTLAQGSLMTRPAPGPRCQGRGGLAPRWWPWW